MASDASLVPRGKNFIRLAVCELRFPTLLELEHTEPTKFQKAIRTEYPTYDRATDMRVNPAGITQAVNHQFKSRSGRWTVSMRQSSLTLETTDYDSFAAFSARLVRIAEAARETIDADFFTRVGLRYINAIEVEPKDIRGWVNDLLIAPLAIGAFGPVTHYLQHVQGMTKSGGYIFRHGTAAHPSTGKPEYMLDFDFFAEAVELKQLKDALEHLHTGVSELFLWSSGTHAREYLERAKASSKGTK